MIRKIYFGVICIWFTSCKPYSKIKGKWLASFQESYTIFNFNKKHCTEIYNGPKGKFSKSKYNYKLENDTLYLYNFISNTLLQKHFVSFENDNIIKFKNVVFQKYSKLKRITPILNKPNF